MRDERKGNEGKRNESRVVKVYYARGLVASSQGG